MWTVLQIMGPATIPHTPPGHPCHECGQSLRPLPYPLTSVPLILCTSPACHLCLAGIPPEPRHAIVLPLSPLVTGNQNGCLRSYTPNRPTLEPELTVCIGFSADEKINTCMGESNWPYPVLLWLPASPLPRGETFIVEILLAIPPKPYYPTVGNRIPKEGTECLP